MPRVLRHREFRLLWLGQTASTIGDRLVVVALALYVSAIGSPSDVGIVLAAHAVPFLGLLLLGGVWADRLPRHRVMLAADAARGIVHAILAALILTGTPPIWAIAVLEALYGAAEAFFRPAYTGLVPQTVPAAELQEANATSSVVSTVAEFAGPALATALVLGAGAGWAFGVDAATFAVSAAFLVRLRPLPRGDAPPEAAMLADLREGWSEFRARAWVWVTVVLAAVALLFTFAPYVVLGPTVALDVYGDRAVYGIAATVLGAGTVAGALAALRVRPRRPMLAAYLAVMPYPVAIAAFAVGAPVALVFALFAASGTGLALFTVWWETALAERIPPALLSRVSAYDWMGSLGLLPVGYLLAGPLASAFGDARVLVAGAALALVAQLGGLLVRDVRAMRRLEPSAG